MSESFTKEDREKISRFLSKTRLHQGLGSAVSPCSIAAINIALTGDIGDHRPPCMSPVIHRFIIEAQDKAAWALAGCKAWSEAARLNHIETTLRSFEPAALLRRLIEHPNGLPAGWDS